MKLLFDLLPVILFFVTFKFAGIYTATAVAIAASVVQVAWMYFTKKKVDPMALIGLGVIVVLGGATLLSHNEMFIKWKPTALYLLFALTLLTAQVFFRRNLMKALLGAQISLPERIWTRLNVAWICFFTVLAGVNLFVAYAFSTETWVNFKLFGIMGLLIAFVIGQSFALGSHMKQVEAKEAVEANGPAGQG